jgi:hypothetical protein
MENNNTNSNRWLIELQKKREEQKSIDEALTKRGSTIYILMIMALALL